MEMAVMRSFDLGDDEVGEGVVYMVLVTVVGLGPLDFSDVELSLLLSFFVAPLHPTFRSLSDQVAGDDRSSRWNFDDILIFYRLRTRMSSGGG